MGNWESIQGMQDTENMTWGEFETIFLEKYFPHVMRESKAREFMYLVQRDMTVSEYRAKFEELSQFAPHMLPNDATRARCFEEGLRSAIKDKIAILKLTRYADVVERALIAEKSVPETKRVWNPKFTSGGQSNKRKRFGPPPHLSNPQQTIGAPQDAPICYLCGQVGHVQRFCPRRPTSQTFQSQPRASSLPQQNQWRSITNQQLKHPSTHSIMVDQD